MFRCEAGGGVMPVTDISITVYLFQLTCSLNVTVVKEKV